MKTHHQCLQETRKNSDPVTKELWQIVKAIMHLQVCRSIGPLVYLTLFQIGCILAICTHTCSWIVSYMAQLYIVVVLVCSSVRTAGCTDGRTHTLFHKRENASLRTKPYLPKLCPQKKKKKNETSPDFCMQVPNCPQNPNIYFY